MFNIGLPMLIASLPLLLHGIDKVLEYKFEPLDKEKLRNLMHKDDRLVVSRIGESTGNFEAVGTYFEFQKGCHFVSTLFIFNILSLLLALAVTASSENQINTLPLLIAFCIFVLLALFLKRVWNGSLLSTDVEATTNWFQRVWRGKLVASDVGATRNWELIAISTFVLVLSTEFVVHVMHSSVEAASEKDEVLLAIKNTMESIDRRIEAAGERLSPVPKTIEGIEKRFDNTATTLSGIRKTLVGIDGRLLDIRIMQPVNLSYLTGTDCRRVQQTLKEVADYKGRVDGICDGLTNAAAQDWQMQQQQTIAPARSAEEIVARLRPLPSSSAQ
jgi:hypothetical protein